MILKILNKTQTFNYIIPLTTKIQDTSNYNDSKNRLTHKITGLLINVSHNYIPSGLNVNK